MSGLPSRAFSSVAGRAQFTTYAGLNQNVGGGDKKAGFPNMISMNTAWDNIFITPKPLSVWQFTMFPNVRPSRPVGSNLSPNPYWRANGVQF